MNTTNNDKFLTLQKKISECKFYKNSKNPFFKSTYISLNDLMKIIMPVLNEQGLLMMQCAAIIDGISCLQTTILDPLDKDGFKLMCVYQLLLKTNDPQSMGSSITYARRYSLCLLLGIVADDDDDANLASNNKSPAKPIKINNVNIVNSNEYEDAIKKIENLISLKDKVLCRSILKGYMKVGVIKTDDPIIGRAKLAFADNENE